MSTNIPEVNVIEQGVERKVRFELNDPRVKVGGELTVEHLYDLTLPQLNSIAIKVAALIGTAPIVSFIDTNEGMLRLS